MTDGESSTLYAAQSTVVASFFDFPCSLKKCCCPLTGGSHAGWVEYLVQRLAANKGAAGFIVAVVEILAAIAQDDTAHRSSFCRRK